LIMDGRGIEMKNEVSADDKSDQEENENGGSPAKEDELTSNSKNMFDRSIVDNVPVILSAYLGESEMTVSELMALESGSVVTLDASLNHFAELRLNDTTIARGEIVAVGDNFGIRITEIQDIG